jgi:prepilin signal peptidase PulO-like enzyme (type II secretory pathway)
MQMWWTFAWPVLAGGACAALVNYLSDVLPRSRSLSAPACPHCGKPYPWQAYVMGATCPSCGRNGRLRPVLVDFTVIALSLYTWIHSPRMGYWAALLLLTYFAVVIVIDVEHRLILRPVSGAGAALAIFIGTWQHGVLATLVGAIAGFILMYLLYLFGAFFTRLRARRLSRQGRPADGEEALGWGDVTLGVVLGLLLGWPLIWLALLLGVLIGGAIGLIVVISSLLQGAYGRQALTLFMPYGPSLILGASCILFLPELVSAMLPK